jgi:hypothetical protein
MSDDRSEERSLWQRLLAWDRGLTPRDRSNQRRFVLALLAWAISFAAVPVLQNEWVPRGAAATAVALVPVAVGFLALATYLRFLRDADEMTRRMQLEGLAIGFGAGAIFTMGYPVLEMAGWPVFPDSTPAAVLMLGWGVGQLVALRRYM